MVITLWLVESTSILLWKTKKRENRIINKMYTNLESNNTGYPITADSHFVLARGTYYRQAPIGSMYA